MKKKLLLILIFLLCANITFAQNPDIDLLRCINLERIKSLDPFFRLITNSVTFVAIILPLLIFLGGWLRKKSQLKKKAICIAVAVLVASIISTILKHSINRVRPFYTYSFVDKVTDATSPAFPSGHTTTAFALALSLSIAFPKSQVRVISFLWAIAVGYSRLDLGVHYPTDVLAGAVLGCGSAYLIYTLNYCLNEKANKKKPY